MKKRGVIFQSEKTIDDSLAFSGLTGMINSHLLVSEWQELVRPVKRGMKIFGKSLVLGCLLVVLTTGLLPVWLSQGESERKTVELKKSIPGFEQLIRLEVEKLAKVTEATYFTIEIPKIKAYSKVIPNVNMADKQDYQQAFEKGVAHAAGTYLPGMNGWITLVAHSTDSAFNVDRYNAVFYRLDELVISDEIVIWYMGEKWVYKVADIQITAPDDVFMFQARQDGEKLYLVTCTPRGTIAKRLVIKAVNSAY